MRRNMIAFIGIFLLILVCLNAYIAVRGWNALTASYPRLAVFFVVFVFISALMFVITRWLQTFLPYALIRPLYIWGVYWIGVMYYAFLLLVIIDLLRIFKRFFPEFVLFQIPGSSAAFFVMALIICLMVYGTWNARHPIISEYHLTLAKKESSLSSIRVAMLSDTHLGWVYRGPELQRLVERVNDIQPDMVLFAGDIVDEGVDIKLEQEIPSYLKKITAPLGVYAVLGNHEYISGQQDLLTQWFEQVGIHVLRDNWIKLPEGLYIAGREDSSHNRSTDARRLSLEALLTDIDHTSLPLILLDHQPGGLEDASLSGVDLQFSGHTHYGQMFPNHLFTGKIFAQDWGYYKQNTFQAIVSCGYGTWGPPIRIGSHSEIVVANITFE